MSNEYSDEDIFDVFADRGKKNGVSVLTVSDGTVFYFSAEELTKLLEQAAESPAKAAILFVKHSSIIPELDNPVVTNRN